MTAHAALATSNLIVPHAETKHRRRVIGATVLAITLFAALAFYGRDYYALSLADRPFSPKHSILKPSGVLGINLGLLGVLLFCGIFLYPLRKHWAWLQKRGNSTHWLNYHVVLGVTAPICIAFHSSFKFRGVAGVAYWLMVAVALSGLVGRYLYAQIPRRVTADELSLKVLHEVLVHISVRLQRQRLIAQADLQPLFHLPRPNEVAHWPIIVALGYMVASDLSRPFRIARLRLRTMGIGEAFYSLGGLFPGKNTQLECVIQLVRQQALLARRIVFLSRAQRVFQLWHVVHKPFSYAFAVLALLHIVVAMLLGFV